MFKKIGILVIAAGLSTTGRAQVTSCGPDLSQASDAIVISLAQEGKLGKCKVAYEKESYFCWVNGLISYSVLIDGDMGQGYFSCLNEAEAAQQLKKFSSSCACE